MSWSCSVLRALGVRSFSSSLSPDLGLGTSFWREWGDDRRECSACGVDALPNKGQQPDIRQIIGELPENEDSATATNPRQYDRSAEPQPRAHCI
jgi:hypothetical protein